MLKKFFPFAFVLVFFGCTKEEVAPREYPRVTTTGATNINSQGATFHGEVIFASGPVTDHGFLWNSMPFTSASGTEKITLGPTEGTGPFEAQCERSLTEGVKYYLRAYVVGNGKTVLGPQVEFTSLGSKAPAFKTFFPTIGTWSDTVTIVGENFSQLNPHNIVKFNDKSGTVFYSTPDTIKVKVPGDLINEKSSLTVSVAGNTVSHSGQFQLMPPEIESVTPTMGLPNTPVVINGKYLLGSVSIKVYFGTVEASITNWSPTSIECKVPNVPNGDVLVKVVTGDGNLFDTAPFSVRPENLPELTNVVPLSADLSETIKLVGDYFGVEPGQTTVKFDDADASILSISKTEIEVSIPYYVKSRNPTITVTSFGSGVSTNMFTLKSPTVTSYTPQRGGDYTVLTITGSRFTVLPGIKVYLDDTQLTNIYAFSDTELQATVTSVLSHTGKIKVTYFDQEFILSPDYKTPWMKLTEFPGDKLTHTKHMIYGGQAYVGFSESPNKSRELWKFNGTANQWDRLNDFPGPIREQSGFMFALGTKGYYGGGSIDPMTMANDVWQYDFGTDAWSQKNDFPMTGYISGSFTLGGEAYVIENNSTNDVKFWRYNSATDSWTIKSTTPLDQGYGAHFTIGSAEYFFDSYSVWKYTPSTNQWTAVSSLPTSQPSYAFSIGSFGYAGNNYVIFKFNPATNTWTEDVPLQLASSPGASFSLGTKGYIFGEFDYSFQNYGYEYDPSY